MPPYFTRIEPDPALARGYVYLLDAIRDFTTKGRIADAAAVRAILADMWREYEGLSARAAVKADAFVRDRIRQTQVRPDASGRLRDSVQSHPLPTTFPAGSVGIADLQALNTGTINPSAPTKGSYWRAQEYGTAAHVGRIVPGYFQPGQSRPAAAEFRMHPYFEAQLYQRGTPAMLIQRPLQARRFLRDGAAATAVWHAQESNRIQRKAIARLRAI